MERGAWSGERDGRGPRVILSLVQFGLLVILSLVQFGLLVILSLVRFEAKDLGSSTHAVLSRS